MKSENRLHIIIRISSSLTPYCCFVQTDTPAGRSEAFLTHRYTPSFSRVGRMAAVAFLRL